MGRHTSPMSDRDLREAVDRFLDETATVYGEYEQGYMDADAALNRLERHVTDLRAAAEGGGEAEGAEADGTERGE